MLKAIKTLYTLPTWTHPQPPRLNTGCHLLFFFPLQTFWNLSGPVLSSSSHPSPLISIILLLWSAWLYMLNILNGKRHSQFILKNRIFSLSFHRTNNTLFSKPRASICGLIAILSLHKEGWEALNKWTSDCKKCLQLCHFNTALHYSIHLIYSKHFEK